MISHREDAENFVKWGWRIKLAMICDVESANKSECILKWGALTGVSVYRSARGVCSQSRGTQAGTSDSNMVTESKGRCALVKWNRSIQEENDFKMFAIRYKSLRKAKRENASGWGRNDYGRLSAWEMKYIWEIESLRSCNGASTIYSLFEPNMEKFLS